MLECDWEQVYYKKDRGLHARQLLSTYTTYGVDAPRQLPPAHRRHRGDVIALFHFKSKSLEERVRRRAFERRPNTIFKVAPKPLNDTEVRLTAPHAPCNRCCE